MMNKILEEEKKIKLNHLPPKELQISIVEKKNQNNN